MTDHLLSDPSPLAQDRRPGGWRWLRDEAVGYLKAAVVAYGVVTFLFTTVGVVGASMAPTFDGGPSGGSLVSAMLSGDRLFVPKYETWLRRLGLMSGYQRSEVVVLRQPANAPTALESGRRVLLVKRVVAVPGDRVRIEAGQLVVNGRPVPDGGLSDVASWSVEAQDFPVITAHGGEVSGLVVGFVFSAAGTAVPQLPRDGWWGQVADVSQTMARFAYGSVIDNLAPLPAGVVDGRPFLHEILVPDGHYFVMGDNRGSGGSEDSRAFGLVPHMALTGRATAVIFPPRRDGAWNWRLLPRPAAFAGPEAAGG